MKILVSRRRIPGTLLRSALLCVGLTLLAGLARAQKTTNPDGSTTTTTRDDTYGQGGTRETTTSADGTTRELQKDADGRPMHATEKDKNGNTQTEIFWKYNNGRVEEVSIRTKKRQWFAARHYKDAKDDTGKTRYMVSDFDTDQWEITLGAPEMESILKKFGLVLWPQVAHLTAGPGPKDTSPKANDHPKQQVLEKTSLQSDSSAATNTATAQLVGVVYDKDSRPGEPVTLSLTTDPKKYADIPGIGVVEMKVPAAAGASGQAVLQGLVVDVGDGRVHRGDKVFTVLVANAATNIPILFGQSASLLLGSRGDTSKAPSSTTTGDASTDHKYPTTPTPDPKTVGDPKRIPDAGVGGGMKVIWDDAQGRSVKAEEYDSASNLRVSTTTEYSDGGEDKKSQTRVVYGEDGAVSSTTITEWDDKGGSSWTITQRDGTKVEGSHTQLQNGGTLETTTYDPKGRVTQHQTLTTDGGTRNGTRETTTYSGDNDQKGKTTVEHLDSETGDWLPGPGPVIVAPLIPLPPATSDDSGKAAAPGADQSKTSPDPLPGITIPLIPPGQAPPLIIQSVDTGKAGDFYTPPVVQNTSVIHGPLSGNAQQMRITVDNQPAQIVTATPRSVYFDLPPALTAGPHTLTLQDGPRSASAPIVKLGLVMKADQLQLQRGQSTNYSATVLLGPLPESVWQQGGTSPELVNASNITKLAPSGFQVPQAGQPGAVLFHLENDSRQTVTIKPSQNETITRVLHQQDFQGGQFIEAGVIQSKQSGGFDIKATVQTFFASIALGEFSQAAPVPQGSGVLSDDKEGVKIKGKTQGGSEVEQEVSKKYREATNKPNFVLCNGGKGCDPPIFEDFKNDKKHQWVSCKKADGCSKQCKDATCRLFYKGSQGKGTASGTDSKGNATPAGKDLTDADNWMPVDTLKEKQPKLNTNGDRVENNPSFAYACICTCPAPADEKK